MRRRRIVLRLTRRTIGVEEVFLTRDYILGDWLAMTARDELGQQFADSKDWSRGAAIKACEDWLETTGFEPVSDWQEASHGASRIWISPREEAPRPYPHEENA